MIFKEICGIDSTYVACSDGRIYSRYKQTPRALNAGLSSSGNYKTVNVKDSSGKRISRDVHRLICIGFHGMPPTKRHQVAHKDGNSLNNLPENLCWKLPKRNLEDRFVHETHDSGTSNSRAYLDDGSLFVMRWLLGNSTLTQDEIGYIIGVNRVFVAKVSNKMRYGNVKVSVVSEVEPDIVARVEENRKE